MIKFIRENSYLIVKLMLNQFGMTVFGLILALATNANETLLLITGLFAFFMYMFLLYTVVWEEGSKHKIRVDGGREKYKPLNGLWLGICANIPNFIVAVLLNIGYIFGKADGLFQMEWAGNLFAVMSAVARLINGMYLGLVQLYSPYNPIAFLLIIIPGVAMCTFGYYTGTKHFGLKGLFVLEKSDKDSKKSKSK